MAQDLIESFDAGIATLTLNRPEARNALTREMMAALADALPRLALDPAVRAVVLTGAGNAFFAGGDVKGFGMNAWWANPGLARRPAPGCRWRWPATCASPPTTPS